MNENLIYRTGEAPINAEPTPQVLLDHDITPADYFYIRCHGEVPKIEWDSHFIEIQVQDNVFNFTISMDDLKANFKPVTMAVTMACDGNRRKELNVFGGHSNGFDWGCCAVSTGKFEGVLLRELLTKSVPEDILQGSTHVIFESADELKKGHYGTSLPLSDVLQSSSDFLIAYGLNGDRLPKQHGYPVRTILPGYVGGRSVKWLKKIILSQSESDNPYHIQDNSLFPPFVTSTALMSKYINEEKNAYEKGESPVRQRSILYELNVNSAILSPANGSTLRIEKDLHKSFSFQGYAYDGGGRRIVRVEVTLDDGVTWLEAEITYPLDYEPPHGDKFYIMCKWKVNIPVWKVASSMKLSVRAWNQSFNTQPRNYTWNILGMMNNAWYTVQFRRKESIIEILHPVSMSPRDTKGWLELAHGKSVHYEEKTVPPIRYTRKQVSQHNSVSDAWVIIDDKVYDLTDFLNMHPGGQASILAHAGQDVTTLFYDIHSEDTHVLKAAYIIGHLAEDGESTAPDGEGHAKHPFLSRKHPRKTPEGHEIELNPFKWTEITLKNKEQINHDTRRFTFALSFPDKRMWLPWGKHVNIGVELHDRMVVRPYTPVKPVKGEEDNGTFELVVKIYFSTDERPGGEMTQILEKLSVGDKVLVKGPEGVLWYLGNGQFCIHGHFFYCNKMNFIVGGTGITPALTIMRAVILAEKLKNVTIRLVFSNKTPADILCQEELEEIVSLAKSASVKVCHVISRSDEENEDKLKEQNGFAYESGRVNQEILKKHVLSADDDSFCFLCGPPAMIAKAVLPALASLGFDDNQILEF